MTDAIPARPAANLAEELANFVATYQLSRDPQREHLVERAKLHLLDGVGVALAASTMEDRFANQLAEAVEAYGSQSECSVIGLPRKAAAPLAAFLNGSLIHGCEYDDIYYERTVHTEGIAIPPVLAVAEREGLSGQELIEAWVLATEVCLRMACGCASEKALYDTGFHNTAIFGTFGAAAGAGKVLKLSEAQLTIALSLGASFASGTVAGWNHGSGRNKSLQPGWASMNGLHAVLIASTGYACASDTLDGPTGLYASHSWRHGWDRGAVVSGFGSEWKLLGLAFKLHPAGGMVQSAIEATQKLVEAHSIEPREVLGIEVEVPAQFDHVLKELLEDSYHPSSGYTMFSSWPCNIARTILSGYVGIEHLTQAGIKDPSLLDLSAKVRCQASADTRLPPADRPTTVTIRTSRGAFTSSCGRHAGHPGRNIAPRVLEKFRRNAALRLGDEDARRVEERIMCLQDVRDVREITAHFAPVAY